MRYWVLLLVAGCIPEFETESGDKGGDGSGGQSTLTESQHGSTGTDTSASSGSSSSTSTTTSSSTDNCGHDVCDEGDAMVNGCSDCVTLVCQQDGFCCSGSYWDSQCVYEAETLCEVDCPDPAACHSVCQVGSAMDESCDLCVALVCYYDATCCTDTGGSDWDADCVVFAQQLVDMGACTSC